MFVKSNYKIYNQSIDLHLGSIEDENLVKQLKKTFRMILFESETFLMKESKEKTVGLHAENEGVGTTLLQNDEEEWVINFGFGSLDLSRIEEMLSLFEPLGKILKDIEGDMATSLVYVLEDGEEADKDKNSFLKEIALTPPDSLVEDELRRIIKIRRFQDATVYTIQSLKKDSLSLNEIVALMEKEKANAERVFIPSLHSWLSSIKIPEPVENQGRREIDCSNIILQSKSVH